MPEEALISFTVSDAYH